MQRCGRNHAITRLMSCLSEIATGQRYGGLAHCKITQLSCEWLPQQALCLPQQNKVQPGASCGQSIDLYSMLSRCPLCWCLCSCIYQLFSCNCNPRDFWLDIRRRGLNAFCVSLLSAPSLGLACQSGQCIENTCAAASSSLLGSSKPHSHVLN